MLCASSVACAVRRLSPALSVPTSACRAAVASESFASARTRSKPPSSCRVEGRASCWLLERDESKEATSVCGASCTGETCPDEPDDAPPCARPDCGACVPFDARSARDSAIRASRSEPGAPARSTTARPASSIESSRRSALRSVTETLEPSSAVTPRRSRQLRINSARSSAGTRDESASTSGRGDGGGGAASMELKMPASRSSSSSAAGGGARAGFFANSELHWCKGTLYSPERSSSSRSCLPDV